MTTRTTKQDKAQQRRDDIARMCRTFNRTAGTISMALMLPERVVRKHLNELAADGIVRHNGRYWGPA